jgi:hypothetical protein
MYPNVINMIDQQPTTDSHAFRPPSWNWNAGAPAGALAKAAAAGSSAGAPSMSCCCSSDFSTSMFSDALSLTLSLFIVACARYMGKAMLDASCKLVLSGTRLQGKAESDPSVWLQNQSKRAEHERTFRKRCLNQNQYEFINLGTGTF